MDASSRAFSLVCSLNGAFFSVNAKASSGGVLDRSNAANPLNDWNIVHLPYCTGDLHLGNSARQAPAESAIVGPLSYEIQATCSAAKLPIHQVGYTNSEAVLQWTLANNPSPEEIVVGGTSAGLLAAQAFVSKVSAMWQAPARGIRVRVLADSYVRRPGREGGRRPAQLLRRV